MFIVNRQILADRIFQLDGAAMRAAFDLTLAQSSEPALDLVQPGSRGGGEMDMEARTYRSTTRQRRIQRSRQKRDVR